ncbi:MAG: YbgA family protein [Anaerolineae bacterium]
MLEFPRPVVVVSKCLGFATCRWNGVTIPDENIDRLAPLVEFIPVCAEVEIGLGVPRAPVRVVAYKDELQLNQPGSGRDCTAEMQQFCERFLSGLDEVDGFILKSRSPSCGVRDVKIYPDNGKASISSKGSGFLGGAVLQRFGDLPIEDEARLSNARLREHFYTRLYARARFRQVQDKGTMRDLVRYQSEQKLLLMAYNQSESAKMGRIVANPEKKKTAEVYSEYAAHLAKALAHPPRLTANINVLMHALGYFSEKLTSQEKAYFLETLEQYRAGSLPLSVCIALVQSWIIRFKQPYLQHQSFFNSYPAELVTLTDTSRGRPAQ